MPAAVAALLADDARRHRLAAAAHATWRERELTWDANAVSVLASLAVPTAT
jgi:hypothetical protein